PAGLQFGHGQTDTAAIAVAGVPPQCHELGVAAGLPVGLHGRVAAIGLDDPVQQRGADADVDLGVEEVGPADGRVLVRRVPILADDVSDLQETGGVAGRVL